MTQHRPRRRSRTPPGRGDDMIQAARPTSIERKSLREMTPAERADWYTEQRAELEDFCSYAQSWAKGRERRGIQNENDDRYQQFFIMAADLIGGLEELRQEAAAEEDRPDE